MIFYQDLFKGRLLLSSMNFCCLGKLIVIYTSLNFLILILINLFPFILIYLIILILTLLNPITILKTLVLRFLIINFDIKIILLLILFNFMQTITRLIYTVYRQIIERIFKPVPHPSAWSV